MVGLAFSAEAPGGETAYAQWRAVLSGLCVALGVVVLAGWQFEIGPIRTVLPGQAPMQPTTAICFLALGLAGLTMRWRLVAGLLAAVALYITLGTCFAHVIGDPTVAPGFSLYRAAVDTLAVNPGRRGLMAPATAISLSLLAICLVAEAAFGRRMPRSLHVAIAGFALLLPLLSLLGYLLEVRGLRGAFGYTDMALHTAVGVSVLGLACLAARPDAAWVRLVGEPGVAGRMVRSLIPVVVVLPMVLAWLGMQASNAGIITSQFRLAVITLIEMCVLAVVALEGARRVGLQTRKVETRERELAQLVANASEAIVTADEAGRVVGWNRQAELLFGWSAAEAEGALLQELIIPPAMREAHVAGMRRFLDTGQSRVIGRRVELPALRRDGSEISTEIAISATYGADGWRFTALIHDITERKAETELFENSFTHAALGKALVSLDGRFVKVNEAFCRLVGLTQEEMLAADFQQITHPDDLDADLALVTELLDGKRESYDLEKRYLHASGEVIWVQLTASLVRERDGAPKFFIAQVQDLTARRRAEANYRVLAENVSDMVAIRDLNSRVRFMSPSSVRVLGYTPEELKGTRPTDFMPEEEYAAFEAAHRRLIEGPVGGEVRHVMRMRRRDGVMIWVSVNARLAEDEDGPIVVTASRDVTERERLEAELRTARAAAEAAAQVKSEFLANMSHELRTPLTSVVGFTQLIREQPDLAPLTRRYAERVGDAGRALLSIVNDVLDFSKLEAGQVSFRPEATAIERLARSSLELFQPQAGAKDIDLILDAHLPPDLTVMVDPDRLRQVLLNLIGNAVKFTEAGGVTVALRYAEDAGRLRIEVADTGPGIPEEALDRLFKRFSQVDGTLSRGHGGTGLGLAICKGVIEAMGGEIGVTTEVGKGSRFWCEAPVSRVDPVAITAEATASASLGAGLRILVADDHPTNRELAALYLAGIGAEVTEAADGEEAVELAETWPYDLILLDLRMPKLDGEGAIRKIRAGQGPNDRTPVLAFTAETGPDTSRRVTELGFQGLVSKPIVAQDLIDALGKAHAFQPSE